jgi:Uroporphyrinogen decarboxylase (URO-D)
MWYTVNDSLAIECLTFAFLPSWFHGNYGLTYGRKFVFDPDYRIEQHRFMARTVYERFPGLQIGSPDPQPQVIQPDFGNAITAAAAGCEVAYPEDNYPWNLHLPMEKAGQLTVPPDLRVVFPYNEIASQVAYLNRKLGQDAKIYWNQRGVLNDACLIGGADFLTEFGLDSPDSRRLIDYSNGMLTSVTKADYEWFHITDWCMLANCTVMMVRPKTYETRLLAYDQEMYRLVTRQGRKLTVHHCGSFEKYASIYRKLPEIFWLEIGWGSDYRLALNLFPESILSYILSAVFVSTASRQEVRDTIMGILEATRGNWHRLRLSMADIEAGTPDENLYEIYECCKRAR